MDALVGRVVAECDRDGQVLMIISDHGFNSFRRGVDLNRWLEMEGYLRVHPAAPLQKYLAAVERGQTRAFAVGLAGMFINLKGRQSRALVAPGAEATALCREIARKRRPGRSRDLPAGRQDRLPGGGGLPRAVQGAPRPTDRGLPGPRLSPTWETAGSARPPTTSSTPT